MREVLTVLVDELNFHSAPGGENTKTGNVALKGDRYTVITRKEGPQVKWAQTQAGDWLAVKNKVTGEVFSEIKWEADAQPDPVEPSPETSPLFKIEGWQIGAFAVFIVVVALFVFW